MDSDRSTLPPSRRSFLRLSAAASAAMALRIVTEPMLARAGARDFPPGAVVIDANENPLGPCSSAREAMAAVLPQGGRYLDGLTDDLAKQIAQMEGVKTDFIAVQAGSTELLHHTV